ncbi:hypothetical protein CXB37_15865 [Pseudomonas syringae pv. syringae]|nr:hypothetical protein CXB37_15865 [Pseudomonas syringae pv. syringae]
MKLLLNLTEPCACGWNPLNAKATATATLSETSKELFVAGCGGIGPAGIGCQLYMAGGGSNPVSGDQATSSERVMYGAQALLNGLGLFGAVYDGAAVGVRAGQVDGTLAAKATSIEFLPKVTRNSAGQIETNITQGSAIKTLESNGYKKTISQDGSVTVLTNGEKTYRFYPSSTSTGQPSASLTIDGVKKPTAKIRFSGD